MNHSPAERPEFLASGNPGKDLRPCRILPERVSALLRAAIHPRA
jgi:hypothetical protein